MTAASDYTLRPMTLDDATSVRRIWDRRFGAPESTQDNWIEAAVDPTHSVEGLVAVAPESETVLGFSFLEVGGRSYTRQYLGLETLDVDMPVADQNGIFHLSCVRTDREGNGIGSAFYIRRLDILAERGISTAFGIAWHRPHTVDSCVLFDKYHFTCYATVDEYYERVGHRPHCPDCDERCSCTASLYGRTISSDSAREISVSGAECTEKPQ